MSRSVSRMLAMVAGLLLIAALGTAVALADGRVSLFNGKNFDGWDFYLKPDSKESIEDIWQVRDGVIRCKGSSPGYIITNDEYSDYVLRLEWKWGDEVKSRRNSGVFVHVVGEDQVWPKGVEAQLAADQAGDIWLVEGAKLRVDPERQDPKVERHYFRMKNDVEVPLGEWNQYEITCQGDTITLKVNGELVNVGTESELTRGKILLQSEGAEIFFRNITLEPLK